METTLRDFFNKVRDGKKTVDIPEGMQVGIREFFAYRITKVYDDVYKFLTVPITHQQPFLY